MNQLASNDLFGAMPPPISPAGSSAYDDLQYGAFALGDIGPQVRDEFVRRPWLTDREKLEAIATIAEGNSMDQDDVDNSYSEGKEDGIVKVHDAVKVLLCDEDADETELRKCVEAIRAEVA